MSVGVCIINQNGIALAADSAGTFTNQNNKMFYNSVNKVFSLSKNNILGAIAYGNLSIYNVSVDQILKEFSKYLDETEKINDFFEVIPLFKKFIEEKNDYYKFNLDESRICKCYITELVNKWGAKINAVIDEKEAEDKIEQILSELNTFINNSDRFVEFDVVEYIKGFYKDYYDSEIDRVVSKLNLYSDKKTTLWELICTYFQLPLKSEAESKTGIFFAGYGAEDAHPKFIKIDIYQIINGKLKYSEISRFEESRLGARIVPLAQEDVILTFCKGMSNVYLGNIPQFAESMVNATIDKLPSTFDSVQKNEIKNAFSNYKKELSQKINEQIEKNNIDPLLKSVMLISPLEMSFLAESLVNITALKRTYAIDGNQQTVGGPTDVAILTKCDGFVWIKKKNNLVV